EINLKKSLGLNAVLSGLQSLLNLIFPLITFPYASRVLSVSGMGKYNFAGSINGYFLLIAALGINTFAIREGAKFRDDREKISAFASKVFTINLISTLIAYILLGLTLLVTSNLKKYIIAILMYSIQIFCTTIGVNWIYTIFEEYAYITIRNIIFKIISVILLFAFVRHSGDYLNYVAITVFASAGSYILNYLYAKRFVDLKLNFNFNWKEYLQPIFIIFISTVAVQIYVNSDTTMIGFMQTNYVVGIYGVSVKIYAIIANLLWSVLLVTVPRLAMLMGKKHYREYFVLLRRVINTLILIVFPIMAGLFIFSNEAVVIVGDQKYLRATSSLRILCLALIFKLLGTVFNDCVLIPAKRENKLLISYVAAAVVNILLNFILIPILAENGAALTTLLAEFVSMAMNFYFSRDIVGDIIKEKAFIQNIVSVIGAVTLMCVVCLIGKNFIGNMILRLIITIPIAAVIYCIALFALKNSTFISLFNEVKSRLKLR
ncbi:flippase, partial [Lactobacillus delbrueckii subsp. bulgaricus]